MVLERMAYEDVQQVVQRLYNKALGEIGLSPEQAFAYVQDEAELLHDNLVVDVALQTAIYKWGAMHGLRLSKASVYAQDVLESLSELYRKFNVLSKDEGRSQGVTPEMVADIENVKAIYLNY